MALRPGYCNSHISKLSGAVSQKATQKLGGFRYNSYLQLRFFRPRPSATAHVALCATPAGIAEESFPQNWAIIRRAIEAPECGSMRKRAQKISGTFSDQYVCVHAKLIGRSLSLAERDIKFILGSTSIKSLGYAALS